jgi:S-DNA-T family DNA segregation ATPase FtsK/SpoIIIE
VGIGGDDARVLHADLTAGLLVAGPPGSGRTSALLALTEALRRGGVPVAGPGKYGTDGPAAAPAVVVVDDADELERTTPGAVDRLLAAHPGAAPLVATTSASAATAFQGTVRALAAARRLLVLDPLDPDSASLVGPRASACADVGTAPPGRGVLVQRRAVEPVQVFAPAVEGQVRGG